MSATGHSVNIRDLHFVLFEQLKVQDALSSIERYEDFDRETYEAMIDEAAKVAAEVVWPTNGSGDREGCTFDGKGNVTTPKGYKEAWNALAEGGWIGFNADPEYGGSGLPEPVAMCAGEILTGANPAFSVYGGLTRGAANLLIAHAKEQPWMIETCAEKLNTGEWTGTMCLTEPGAGTAVGDLRTKATPTGNDGEYLIEGEKIFISGGDSDLAENVIHLVLARVEGDPAGTKGISIFLVPKFDFETGERNGAFVSGIEHKMGLNGSATCSLTFGADKPCKGFLIGRQGKGMGIMFHLMNEARIAVGIQGLASAAVAYENALSYAKDRVQGNDLSNMKGGSVAIIKHPDVRRMLMDVKVTVETLRSMLYTTALRLSLAENSEDEDEKKKLMALVELMTPICKSYASDAGFEATVTALQVFGGYGYTQEYPAEQHVRDVKIASIYEGTNGIQAMDLLGRKMRAQSGMVYMTWMGEASAEIAAAKSAGGLDEQGDAVQKAVGFLSAAAMHLGKLGAEGNINGAMIQAMPFLNMFGIVVCGVHALTQAAIAKRAIDGGATGDDLRFYRGKLLNLDYYVANILPKAIAMSKMVQNGDESAMDESLFV